MDREIKKIKVLNNKKNIMVVELQLYEEAIDDEDLVLLETTINNKKIICKGENFFFTLQDLRRHLERQKLQIICNGAARNVHPSPMQLSMGSGRKAYKLYMKHQAKNIDVVDIFDCDETLEFVSIEEQSRYYIEWLKSLRSV